MNNQRYYFNVKMRIIIWLCTYGLQYIIQWYYRKIPVFWLAKGWFPRYIEWILCFPMAPIGIFKKYENYIINPERIC